MRKNIESEEKSMKKLGKKLVSSQATIEAYSGCGVCSHCGCTECSKTDWYIYGFADSGTSNASSSNQNW